jgi:hypothetical protein
LIDALSGLRVNWHGFEWNRYSLFFTAVGLAFLIALRFTRQLDEPAAASMEKLLKELLIQSPQRVWVRLWPRA